MPRRHVSRALILAGFVALSASALGAPDEATTLRFIQGLRDRGYHDLSIGYIDQLRQAPDTPADLRTTLDYEEGRSLLEGADSIADFDRRAEQLDQARAKLDGFIRANPQHARTPEAMVQLAKLLVQRGHLAVLQSSDAKTPAEAQLKLTEARGFFGQARANYDRALERLKAAYDAFPKKFIEEKDPVSQARERAQNALMEAQLYRALVDYEEAQTYPQGSQPRNALLDKGIDEFKDINIRYRTWMAGLYARMWQGKCYEERGSKEDLGAAMGIYDELMGHEAPELLELQQKVDYFRIIVMAKRKDYALAADEAVRWLSANPKARHTEEGLGVQLELAKDLLAQINPQTKPADRDAATKRAHDLLSDVIRYTSKYKPEALALLQQHKPKATAGSNAAAPTNLGYDEAMSQAEQAISAQEWTQALTMLRAALRRVDPAKEPEKANRARYYLAFSFFQSQRYPEAAVVAEHLARHYPRWELTAKATEIGIAALTLAFNADPQAESSGTLARLVDFCNYIAKTWPESEQGDAARLTLGEVALTQRHYLDAAKAFEAVRADSPKRLEAQDRAGFAHWQESLARQGKDQPGSQAEAKTALAMLSATLKARQDAKAQPTDPGLMGNACELAEIHLEQNHPAEALAVLDPLAKAVAASPSSPGSVALSSRLFADELRAHIGAGQVEQAIGDMKALEAAGGSGQSLTQLYYGLGRLLEKEMEDRKARGDRSGLEQIKQSYEKFLNALIASQSGQSYESLQWAGEALLSIGSAEQAATVFDRVLKTYTSDPAFLKTPNAAAKLTRTRLKQVAALRDQHEFDKAQSLLKPIIDQNKTLLEPLLEQGRLAEERAQAGEGRWADSYELWKRLALRLARASPKPKEYYESWYHVAFALLKQGRTTEAQQALKSVMILTPSVGGPEMKAKYEALLAQIKDLAARASR